MVVVFLPQRTILTNAQNAVQKFEDKTKLELQFLDDTGAVQYSSNDLRRRHHAGDPGHSQSALNYQRPWPEGGPTPYRRAGGGRLCSHRLLTEEDRWCAM